jgi:hypothetical protein
MPKLQQIDGKVKHYGYTPEGKRQYERDKAAMKMTGFKPVGPDPDPKPTKPKSTTTTKPKSNNFGNKKGTPAPPYRRPKKGAMTEKDMAAKLRKMSGY